jgi:carbamoyltransferase|tara:strand:- start:2971 stop:4398 length:1428 start_codon:yes stop_codon:yes gene_type:complete
MLVYGTACQNHDGGFSVLKDGTLIETRLSERTTRVKHDSYVAPFITVAMQENKFDKFYISTFNDDEEDSLEELTKYGDVIIEREHHLYHAYCGFHTSEFDNAVVIVVDGNGCDQSEGTEIISVYSFKDRKFHKTIDKIYHPEVSIGKLFSLKCEELGLAAEGEGDFAAGKLMGLAQYKGHKLPEGFDTDFWYDAVEQAAELQEQCNKKFVELVQHYSSIFQNVVLTGGVALNCVANYKVLQKHSHLHIDPICNDNGISIGAALKGYEDTTGEPPNRIESVYLGHEEDDYDFSGLNVYHADYGDVIDLIIDGDAVALFQGRSEVGQRALGNRSLLYDPRVLDGQAIVNEIKQREAYRPFAATVLEEYADEWFRMKKKSPYMSYAVDVLSDDIPAVTHADKTCRVQTLSEKQNPHFYNLIEEFYQRTGVPMLLNTSFNLAGKPLVETFKDAIYTMNKSELEYIFIPEKKVLVCRNIR